MTPIVMPQTPKARIINVPIAMTVEGKVFYKRAFNLADGDSITFSIDWALGELVAQRGRLLAALEKYGSHGHQCKRNAGEESDCDCGLFAAIASVKGGEA